MTRFLVCGALVLPVLAPAAGLAQPVTIEHEEIGCIVAGKYPQMNACFAPASAAKKPRVYFRPETTATWYYVEMTSDAPCFKGVLLRPNKALIDKKIFYYLDVQGGDARTPEYAPIVVASEQDCKSPKPVAPLSATGPVAVFPSSAVVGMLGPAAAGLPMGVVAAGVAVAAVAGGVVLVDDGSPATTTPPRTPNTTSPPATTAPTTTLPPVTAPGATPLVVACQAAPRNGAAPLRVAFSTFPSGGTGSYTFAWSFGDGGSNTNPNPSHTYVTPGVFNATVLVTSGSQTAACSRPITVTTPPTPPPTAPPAPPKLTVSLTGTGTGTVTGPGINCGPDCDETYPAGTVVTLAAAPGAGSTFVGWSGACTGTAPTCTLTMSADKNAVAKFDKTVVTRTLTVIANSAFGGDGTITSGDGQINCTVNSRTTTCTDTGTYPDAAVVTLTAVPGSFSFFIWGGPDCVAAPGTTCTVTMTADKTVTITFSVASLTSRRGPEAAPRRVAGSTQLEVPDAEGQLILNGQVASAVRPGLAATAVEARPGTNRVEAVLVQGGGRPGTWRFEFSGQAALEPGSLRVVAGTVALITGDAVVFRLQGNPGERVVFTFGVED